MKEKDLNKSWKKIFVVEDIKTNEDCLDPFFFIGNETSEYKIKTKCKFCETTYKSDLGSIPVCQCSGSIKNQQEQVERNRLYENTNKIKEDPETKFYEARMKNKRSKYRSKL